VLGETQNKAFLAPGLDVFQRGVGEGRRSRPRKGSSFDFLSDAGEDFRGELFVRRSRSLVNALPEVFPAYPPVFDMSARGAMSLMGMAKPR